VEDVASREVSRRSCDRPTREDRAVVIHFLGILVAGLKADGLGDPKLHRQTTGVGANDRVYLLPNEVATQDSQLPVLRELIGVHLQRPQAELSEVHLTAGMVAP